MFKYLLLCAILASCTSTKSVKNSGEQSFSSIGSTILSRMPTAVQCDSEFLSNIFLSLSHEVISSNVESLCRFYSKYEDQKKCALDEASKRCSKAPTLPFSTCIEVTPEILFSTLLKPGSRREKKICELYALKNPGNSEKKQYYFSDTSELKLKGPLKVLILTSFPVQSKISEAEVDRFDFKIIGENQKLLNLGKSGFSVKFIPSTGWLFVSLNKGKCGYKKVTSNGQVEQDGFTGACLESFNIFTQVPENIILQNITLKDLVDIELGKKPKLEKFLSDSESENSQTKGSDIVTIY